MALIVMGMVLLGFYMHGLEFSPFKLSLYDWHKSFGTLVLFLVAARLIWRFSGKVPQGLKTHKAWEKALAHLAHYGLYILMLLLPLSGWLMSSSGDFSHSFFGLFEMPDLTGKDRETFRFMRQSHEILVYTLLAVLGLHIAGAAKHHVIDKDITLKRMLPFSGPPKGAAGLVIVIAALFYAATAGLIYKVEIAKEQRRAPTQSSSSEQVENGSAIVQETDVSRWDIISSESRITFYADVYGQPFEASIPGFYGDIVFSPDRLAESRVDIRIPMAGVRSGSAERDDYMAAQPWFDAESFPESRFVADNLEKIDENQYVASGSLTLRGVSLPLSLPFSLTITPQDSGRDRASMTSEVVINRLDYGVGQGEWSNTDTVANPVKVKVSLFAERIEEQE